MSYYLTKGQVDSLTKIIKAHGWCAFDIDTNITEGSRYKVSGALYKTEEEKVAAKIAATTKEADSFFDQLIKGGRIGTFYIEGYKDEITFSVITIKNVKQCW